jgi:uncharacterized membrane protein
MRRALTAVAVILAAGTAAGLAILWPGKTETRLQGSLAVDTTKAEVVEVTESTCPGLGNQRCQLVTARLAGGTDAGKRVELQLSAIQGFDPHLDPGDDIRVTEAPEPPPGQAAVAGPEYSFYDFQRGSPMLVLAIAFAVIVLLFARLRGALSLVGLGFSLVLVLLFVVPAILDGKPPLAVAIVGSLAVALITIPLAHGGGPKTLAAVLGTAASLLLTALLALVFTKAAHLTGFSSEEAIFLQMAGANLSLEGLLLAGMVIAALGVLDDVTVSQASTVLALRSANPALRFRQLFAVAQRVGRDHVSATVNTLVLAYVGASLPVLLIFSSTDLGLGEALSTEIVATQVVGTLVGSIGLIAAVPLTTALGALLALGEEPEAPAGLEHGHSHQRR